MCLELDLDRNPALSPPLPLNTYFATSITSWYLVINTIKENLLLLLRGHHLKITDHKKMEKNFSEMVDDIRAPFENHRSQKDWNELFRDGRRHPRPCRLASSQDEDLRLQPGHGMCLLQGETKTISCYKVIFIFFAWNKLVLQSWLLGCSPWLTMWTRKSARESFSSDRWKKQYYYWLN